MTQKEQRTHGPDAAGSIAFILIVLASYASWLVNASAARLAAWNLSVAVLFGLAYCLIGTVGFAQVRQAAAQQRQWITLYFFSQLVLGFGASALLEGINSITILLIPLAWQSVMVRSRAALILVNGVLCVGFVLLYGLLRPDWADALRMSATLIAGVVAAILFGQLAVREQDARAEISRLAEDLQAKNAELRAYAATAEDAAIAGERNRLAREIHDSLGHYLTASAMQMQAARAMLISRGLDVDVPVVIDALRKAEGLSQEALTDVRRSVHALRETSSAQQPLPEALLALFHGADMTADAQIKFALLGQQRRLPPQTDLTLYRVAQEGLTNVRKHACASSVAVNLHYEADCVRLTIHDDGIGLKFDKAVEKNDEQTIGFGLIGLRERISLLGGTMKTGNGKDGGFYLDVAVPV